jgi:hypothetical protein
MSSTTLPRTLTQARDAAVGQLGVKGIPNADWPWPAGNDCLKFVLVSLGLVGRLEMHNEYTSIGAFLAFTPWPRVKASEVRAGDIVLQQWDDVPDPDHVGLCYSRIGTAVRTIEANTSPKVGMPLTAENRGIYDKTRTAGSWLMGGIRPAYKPEAAVATKSSRDEVRLVLAWLNTQLPKHITRSAAGPAAGNGSGDGVMGPVAWLEVQEWGDLVGLYDSPPYLKDGIPAGRSKFVYGEALKRAKSAARKSR